MSVLPNTTYSGSGTRVLVLVGFAEALSAPEVVWSLVDAGFEVAAFSRRGRPAALARSRYVKVTEIDAPEVDARASTVQIERLLEALGTTQHTNHVLLPLDDAALWLCNQASRGDRWTLAGPDGAALELALNKERQVAVARAAGFRVPASVFARTTEDLSTADIAFPLILRSSDAVRLDGPTLRKGRNWICADDAELARSRRDWAGRNTLIVQPFMEGVGEGIFGFVTDDGVMAWSAHRRVRMMNPHGSGSSACAWRSVDESLKSPVTAFLSTVGWRGMFMIELLRTADDSAWFIEFNGRAWGSMALARRQALEYPAWTVRRALDPRFTVDISARSREGLVCRHIGREFMHLLFVLRGPRSQAIRNWPSLGVTLRSLLRFESTGCLYNWRADDWRVFLADSYLTLVRNAAKSLPAMPSGRSAVVREILLVGSSPRVQLEVCRSLGRAGYRVSILRLQPQRTAADASRYCAQSLYIGSPEAGVRAFAQRLATFLRSARFDHVLALDASAMELLSFDRGAPAEVSHVIGPEPTFYREATNRWSALAVARAAGLRTLDTLLLKRGSDDYPATLRLPCMVRPAQESAIVDDAPATLSSRLVGTLRALDAKLRDDLPRADVLLQRPHDGERIDVALCAVAGRVVENAVTVRRDSSGSRSRLARSDPEIVAIAERIAKHLKWTGFMTIQCCRRRGDDALTFLDLQFGAAQNLAALRRSGIDLPRSLLQAIDGAAMSRVRPRRIDAIDDPAPMLQTACSTAGALLQRVGLRLRSTYFYRLGAPFSFSPLTRSQAVLLVCKGNINRSMVAEQILRKHGFTRVASAGLLGMTGRRPSLAAECFITERLGIDATGLRSQAVPGALARLGHVDIVICFERRHVVELVQRYPELRAKVVLLTSLAAERRPVDVDDPHNEPDPVYAMCFERIERLLDQAIERSAAQANQRSEAACGISLPRS